jgi:hypothetical protein
MTRTLGLAWNALFIGLVVVAVAGCGGAAGTADPAAAPHALGAGGPAPTLSSPTDPGMPVLTASDPLAVGLPAAAPPPDPAPEPSTLLLIGSGIAGFACLRRFAKAR